jgi:hypothetical protein
VGGNTATVVNLVVSSLHYKDYDCSSATSLSMSLVSLVVIGQYLQLLPLEQLTLQGLRDSLITTRLTSDILREETLLQ